MDKLLSKLVGMTFNDAHNHLMTLNLPVDLRAKLSRQAEMARRLRRKAGKQAKLSNIYHMELWYRLLAPLKYELNNAKVGQRLKPFDEAPERHEAFTQYIMVMEKLLAGLQKMQTDEAQHINVSVFEQRETAGKAHTETARTPAELAMARGIPNKGLHWTDWINEKTKNRIRGLFDAVPYPKGVKRPGPFIYRIPPDLFKRDQEALQRRTLNELATARQQVQMAKQAIDDNGDLATHEMRAALDAAEDTVNRIKFALNYMTWRVRNAPLPPTWHGYNHLYKKPDASQVDADEEIGPDTETLLRMQFKLLPEPPKRKANRPKRYRK